LERPEVATQQRAIDRADDVPERRPQRDGEEREAPPPCLVDQRRGNGPEHKLDPEAESRRLRRVELGDEPALRAGAAPQARARGEHDPVRLEPRRRTLDLDRVRARHAPIERFGAAGQELQAKLLMADEIPEPERERRCGLIAH
jgi:hypothetical protein